MVDENQALLPEGVWSREVIDSHCWLSCDLCLSDVVADLTRTEEARQQWHALASDLHDQFKTVVLGAREATSCVSSCCA